MIIFASNENDCIVKKKPYIGVGVRQGVGGSYGSQNLRSVICERFQEHLSQVELSKLFKSIHRIIKFVNESCQKKFWAKVTLAFYKRFSGRLLRAFNIKNKISRFHFILHSAFR